MLMVKFPKADIARKDCRFIKKRQLFYFSYNEIEFIMRREISIDESNLFKTFIKRMGDFSTFRLHLNPFV